LFAVRTFENHIHNRSGLLWNWQLA
jgi:hypothetical protein